MRIAPRVPDGWALLAKSSEESRRAERLDDYNFQVRLPAGGPVTLGLNSSTVTVNLAVLPSNDDRRQLDLNLPGGAAQGVLMKKG